MKKSEPEFKTKIMLETIKSRTKDLGLTQKQLAEKTGLRQATISDYFNGKIDPTFSTLLKIAKALKMRIEIIV